MSDVVFSDSWLDQWSKLINADETLPARAPEGVWRIHMRIEGDGVSPYVPEGETIHLMIHITDGRCTRLERTADGPGPRDLDFRFSGPAHIFEEVSAGLRDPVEAGLQGHIKIAGDMSFLLKQAELTKEIVELFMNQMQTNWPHGMPPYGNPV
jgi:hypothetical protein